MSLQFGSVQQDNSQFEKVSALSSLIVLIRSTWFYRNSRRVRSQIKFSTGIIINGDCVLTAAHNIYHLQLQAFCNEIEMIFDFEGTGRIYTSNFRVSMELRRQDYRCKIVQRDGKSFYQHDFALIKLPDKVNKQILKISQRAYLLQQLQCNPNQTIRGFTIGFPDLTLKQSERFKSQQEELCMRNHQRPAEAYIRRDTLVINKTEDNKIQYLCRTLSGQSGSPILIPFGKGQQQQWYVIGVHNSYSRSKATGRGILITSQTGRLLNWWHQELTNHPLYIKHYQQLNSEQRQDMGSILPDMPQQTTKRETKDQMKEQLDKFLEIEFLDLSNEIYSYYKASEQNYQFGSYIDLLRKNVLNLKKILWQQFKLDLHQIKNESIAGSQDQLIFLQGQIYPIEEQQQQATSKPNLSQVQQLLLKSIQEQRSSNSKKSDQAEASPKKKLKKKIRTSSLDNLIRSPESTSKISPESNAKKLQDSHSKTSPLGSQEDSPQDERQLRESNEHICSQCKGEIVSRFICLDRNYEGNRDMCNNCAERHHSVKAEQAILTQLYRLVNQKFYDSEDCLKEIEQSISVMVNLINMNLLKKMLEAFTPKVKKTLQFLGALLFKDEQTIQQKVKSIIQDHSTDQTRFLSRVYWLAQQVNSKQLLQCFECEIDQMKDNVLKAYQSINDCLEQFRIKIPDFEDFNLKKYKIILKSKYESIINIKTEEQFVVKPSNIYDVKEDYYPFIKEIVINKQTEQYQEKDFMKKKRKERADFWLSMHRFAKIVKIESSKDQPDIANLRQHDSHDLFFWSDIHQYSRTSNQGKTHGEEIAKQYMFRQFCKFRDHEQYQWESQPLGVISVILHPKITNLIKLDIRYEPVRCCEYNCQYKLHAAKLFQILVQNPNLEKVAIKGVRIYHFGRFILNFWKIRCLRKMVLKEEQAKLSEDQRRQIEVIERLNPLNTISLDLRILLKVRSREVIYSMDYFLKVFPTVSNLKVQINYSDPIDSLATDPTVIPMLKESLKKISKLKVWVLGQYMLSNITILQSIKDLTNITSLYISDFSQQDGQARAEDNKFLNRQTQRYTRFQNVFNDINRNNEIKKFSIKRCSMAPLSFSLPFAREVIAVSKEQIKISHQSLTNPSMLEMLYLQNTQFEGEMFQFFAQLYKMRFFQIINSNIKGEQLNAIPLPVFNRLRILNISQCPNVGDFFAEFAFPHLQQIVLLDISKTSINPRSVLKIPSIELLRLQISGLNEVEDSLLRKIDRKWPMLRALNIYGCKGSITRQSINENTFKNLTELQISPDILREKTRFRLLVRGVEILPFFPF